MAVADDLNLPKDHTECHIVAQRRYICCECGGAIEELDVYHHVSGDWTGHRRSLFRTCLHCEDAREWLCTRTDWPGVSGVPRTFLFRQLRRHLLDQSRTGGREYRFQALRYVVLMNRRRTAARAAP